MEKHSKEKSSEAEMVFHQYAKILSILKSSSIALSQELFEENWGHFLALANSSVPSPLLFRFIYMISSVNLKLVHYDTFAKPFYCTVKFKMILKKVLSKHHSLNM